jgi:hypothetical protein
VWETRALCNTTVSRLSCLVFWDLTLLVFFELLGSCLTLLSVLTSQCSSTAFSTVKANFLVCSVCVAVSSFFFDVRSTTQCVNVAVVVTVCVRSHVLLL